jgi:hypothetical protein
LPKSAYVIADVCKPVKELTAQSITSPRLRGEVGSRARRGERVRGSCLPHLWMLRGRQDAPHPDPLPASGAREYRAALIHECFLRTFANLCNQVLVLP